MKGEQKGIRGLKMVAYEKYEIPKYESLQKLFMYECV